MQVRRVFFMGSPVVLLFLLSLPSFGEKPILTTLCVIVSNPQRFDGSLVQFQAHYESDGIENSVLVDEANCKLGISLDFPEKLVGEQQLTRALWLDYPGSMGKVISATWMGVFRYFPKQRHKRYLRIREMKHFTFTCDDCPTLHKDDPLIQPEPTWPI